MCCLIFNSISNIITYNIYNRRIEMQSKNKQFKIQRKKLVISKDTKTRQQQLVKNSPHDITSFEKNINNQNINILKQKKQNQCNYGYKRKSLSRDASYKKNQLILQKKQTFLSDNKSDYNQTFKQTSKNIDLDQNIKLITRNNQLQNIINLLITKLKSKQQNFKNRQKFFHIQKNYFVHIIQYIFYLLSNQDLQQYVKIFHRMGQLKDIMVQIYNYCRTYKSKQRLKTMNINSKINQFCMTHQDYNHILKDNINLIQKYNQLHIKASQKLKQLEKDIQQRQKQCDHLGKQVNQKAHIIEQYYFKITQLEQQYQDISHKLSNKQKQYQNIMKEVEKIENFGRQNRQMIKIVSQQYKQIEADIYEYAVYLQSNELASQLNYEPHPFTQIQKNLLKEFQEFNRQNKINDKMRAIKQNCDKVVAFYKKKDAQMENLCDFKTKCIRQFINHMKKWLNNWELKQQYLVNLRSDFVIQNHNFYSHLNKLDENLEQKNHEIVCKDLKDLKSIYSRLQQNYMLGNSFY